MDPYLREFTDTIAELRAGADGSVFFRESSRLWRCHGGDCEVVLARPQLSGWGRRPGGGFWLRIGELQGPATTQLVNERGEPAAAWPGTHAIDAGEFIGSRCAYLVYTDVADTMLCVTDVATGSTSSITLPAANSLAVSDDLLCLRNRDDVEAYGWDLSIRWRREYATSPLTRPSKLLSFFEDLVIVNCGVARRVTDPCQIVGLDRQSGQTVWSYSRPSWASSWVADGYVTLASAGHLIVLDARSGKAVFEAASGLDGHADDTLWHHAGHLVYTSHTEQLLRVFALSGGNLISELRLPAGYTFLEQRVPVPFGDGFATTVLPHLGLRGMVAGLLLAPSFAGHHGTVEIEARTPHRVVAVDDPAGGQRYRVEMESDEIDRVLRFGAIVVKETAALHGYHVWSDERRNKRFNGKVELVLDLGRYDEGGRTAIGDMLAEAQREVRELSVFAGDGKSPIQMLLVPRAS